MIFLKDPASKQPLPDFSGLRMRDGSMLRISGRACSLRLSHLRSINDRLVTRGEDIEMGRGLVIIRIIATGVGGHWNGACGRGARDGVFRACFWAAVAC